MRSTVVPNVMDFDHPPVESDDYADDLREVLGLDKDVYLFLQPTRVVPRKRIELSIQLARWLDMPCAILVPHGAGDEGVEYQEYLARFADTMGVRLLFEADRFSPIRSRSADGEKIYGLADAYKHASLVTYSIGRRRFRQRFSRSDLLQKAAGDEQLRDLQDGHSAKGF